MAASAKGSKSGSGSRKNSGNRAKTNTSGTRKNTGRNNQHTQEESAITNEIILIGVFALTILLFLCNFGLIGVVGDAISKVMFGIFGLTAYIVPVLAFFAVAFHISNRGNSIATLKLVAGCLLFFLIGVIFELIGGHMTQMETYSVQAFYENSAQNRSGGGVISGSVAYALHHYLGMVGSVLVVLVLAVISMVIITEKSFLKGVKEGSRRVYDSAKSDAMVRKERSDRRREEERARREERDRLREEEEARRDADEVLKAKAQTRRVMYDMTPASPEKEKKRNDIHEITLSQLENTKVEVHKVNPLTEEAFDFDKIRINGSSVVNEEKQIEEEVTFDEITVPEEDLTQSIGDVFSDMQEITADFGVPEKQERVSCPNPQWPGGMRKTQTPAAKDSTEIDSKTVDRSSQTDEIQQASPKRNQTEEKKEAIYIPAPEKPKKPYQFPPISLLSRPSGKNSGASVKELKETAMRLQQTLQTFGVRVAITDISQGPAVTRYELQPEQGVKVSKIVGLADDIKLNLAATDIRIEAPIPGKAAIGIEVPNKENTSVSLRELLESKEFKEFPSNLAFAVGKDIAGKVVVSDIAKMPHMLIAGATGSGKSVCINTLILSLIYKASPEDVKLIMIDPKVVELSVYNGIPHLLIPVVTDPKKASGSLQWAVAEMSDRYSKFAQQNVRDLKGYNKKMEELAEKGDPQADGKLPQIVIIVDELADLMMVAPGEVEESICRLAQLARAAGIHLIIATQRPSVDVITGLIKANMPSRVAFSVTSGVDSRTILDMNGAEKLLGKGDMLFYPQGYTKPVRVQGAFVSDNEVGAVADFLKNQALGSPCYNTDIEEKIKSIGSGSGGNSGGTGTEYDAYFAEAGRFIIDKDKASIGMLQRVFKIGFNRAARIMDQLAEAGVVGEEEGTKPRKVLMSETEFEQLIEEIL